MFATASLRVARALLLGVCLLAPLFAQPMEEEEEERMPYPNPMERLGRRQASSRRGLADLRLKVRGVPREMWGAFKEPGFASGDEVARAVWERQHPQAAGWLRAHPADGAQLQRGLRAPSQGAARAQAALPAVPRGAGYTGYDGVDGESHDGGHGGTIDVGRRQGDGALRDAAGRFEGRDPRALRPRHPGGSSVGPLRELPPDPESSGRTGATQSVGPARPIGRMHGGPPHDLVAGGESDTSGPGPRLVSPRGRGPQDSGQGLAGPPRRLHDEEETGRQRVLLRRRIP